MLFNHSVRSRQQIRRNGQTDLFRRLEIDDQLELIDRFNPQITWLRACYDFLNILRRQATYLVEILTVACEAAHGNETLLREHRWQLF